ncbi:hypothetical protein BD413DRAFT_465179, partial [Trametes elegans]
AKYELVSLDLEERPQWFVDNVNPNGQVPALTHGGPRDAPVEEPSLDALMLAESSVLLEFIADLYPDAGLLPDSPVARVKARSFIRKLDDVLREAVLTYMFVKDSGEKVLEALSMLQDLLPPEGYVLGRWSIADAAFAPVVPWVEVMAKTGQGYYKKIETDRVAEALASLRFSRLREYMRINKERGGYKTAYNEVSSLLLTSAISDRGRTLK